MKHLLYVLFIPGMEIVSLSDFELIVKIGCETAIAGVAILTYFHRKSKDK